MRLKAIPLLVLGVLSLLTPELRAQVSDPADRFLTAYQMYTKAESLETSRDYTGALKLLKDSLQILDDIDKGWNPAILEYRRKRIIEAIGRLQGKAGPVASRAAETEPPLPRQGTNDTGISGGIPGGIPGVDVDPPDLTSGGPKNSSRSPLNRSKPSGNDDIMEKAIQERNDLKAKLAQAEGAAAGAKRAAEEVQAKLDKALAERKSIDSQLRVNVQRLDVVEQALLNERKNKTAGAEQVVTLQAELSKLKKESRSLRDERDALEELRGQESARHAAVVKRANDAAQASVEFKKAMDELEKSYKGKLADVEKKLTATQGEVAALNVKLATVTTERDTYKGEVAKLKEDKKNLDKALADNALLMQKLSDAEKQITQFKADNVQKDVLIADLKKEITNVTRQLDDAKKDSAAYQVKMLQLQANLQTTSEKLAMADTNATKGNAEKKKMGEENELLRGIVMRQMKAQAGRDQTRKLILEEMQKMEIKSKDLLQRINFLGEPIVKLSPKEAALFKKPQVEVGDNEIALAAPRETAIDPVAPELPKAEPVVPAPVTSTPPLAVANATPAPLTPPPVGPTPARAVPVVKTSPTPAAIAKATPAPAAIAKATPAPPAPATPAPAAITSKSDVPELAMLDTSRINRPSSLDTPRSTPPTSTGGNEPRTEPATGGNVTETGVGASTVPTELQPTAQAAKDHFDRGNYRDAEKLYETILAKAPTNLYALSNLGVVRFREGKLKLAEEAFRKAIAIAPEDAFSRCTLGIIYYSQTRYDEAVNELTKSLAINPKYAAAHNFLGITASQKGWQEAAQKELETATSLDPNYADAHFNLAVVYATQQPTSPENKENARKFYKRATELGAEKDTSLEALLK